MSKPDKVILVCGRVNGPLLFPDSETGKCAECGRLVEYRPHAPKNRILRCAQCALLMIEDGDDIVTTPRMVADAKEYYRKKHQ
jgi:hypothetical protein